MNRVKEAFQKKGFCNVLIQRPKCKKSQNFVRQVLEQLLLFTNNFRRCTSATLPIEEKIKNIPLPSDTIPIGKRAIKSYKEAIKKSWDINLLVPPRRPKSPATVVLSNSKTKIKDPNKHVIIKVIHYFLIVCLKVYF